MIDYEKDFIDYVIKNLPTLKNHKGLKLGSEFVVQGAICMWLRLEHPAIVFYASQNGTFRGKRQALMMSLTGMRAGIPDLCFPGEMLYVEVKRLKGSRTSKQQKEWVEYLRSVGYRAEITKGFDSTRDLILEVINAVHV